MKKLKTPIFRQSRLMNMIQSYGYSVQEIAEETGIPRRSLYDYCSGKSKLPLQRAKQIANILGCHPTSLISPITLHHSDIQFLYGENYSEVENNLNVLRRSVLQLVLGAGTAFTTLPDLDDIWSRLAYTVKHPHRVDNMTLNQLEELTQIYWQLYHGAIAKVDLLSTLQAHLLTLMKLIDVNINSQATQRICGMASNTSRIISKVYLDMGDFQGRERYDQIAYDFAREGGNTILQSIALGQQAVRYLLIKQPEKGFPFLEHAIVLAEKQHLTRALGWLRITEARSHAKLYQANSVFTAIEKAEIALNTTAADELDSQWYHISNQTFLHYKAQSYLEIQESRKAKDLLLSLHQSLPEHALRKFALIGADLAEAYLQLGEVDQACETLSNAMLSMVQAKSGRALQEIRRVEALITAKNHKNSRKMRSQLKEITTKK